MSSEYPFPTDTQSRIAFVAADVDRRIHVVFSALKTNPGRDWTVREMADLVGLSDSRLRWLFATKVGTSPKRTLNEIRLKEAAELLRRPELRIKQVMFAVGVSDPSRFCRAFRKRFGASPSGYRSRLSTSEKDNKQANSPIEPAH